MPELIRGRYEPLDVVGRGGQGEVLRARDSLHDRQVALKVRAVPTPEEREAVLSEARVLLDVRPHAGLPLVREDFYLGNRYYLVMDWVEGKSLHQVLQERGDPGLPLAAVLGYLQQVAAALDHLHAHEPPVVHGDVKPSNLILTPRGQVVLVDFGVAVRHVAAHRIAMGTRGFVAPELAADVPPTPAADVYSLAATAFALLTGRTPDVTDSDGGAASDREVARALRGALSTDPVRRPGSAGELVAGLESARLGTRQPGILTFLAVEAQRDGRPAAAGPTVATIERHGGSVAGGTGPAVLGVFARATDAIGCALALEDGMDDDPPDGSGRSRAPSIRMALHTGEAERDGDGYRGGTVDRTRAMCARAGDGQILVSQVTSHLARDNLRAGVSLDPVGVRPGEPSSEQVLELSRPAGAGSGPGRDPASSDTLPFERLLTAVLTEDEPAPVRHPPAGRGVRRRTVAALLGAVTVIGAGLVWWDGRESPTGGDRARTGDTTPGATASTAPVPLFPPGTDPVPAGRYSTATFQPPLTMTFDGSWRPLKGELEDVVDLVRVSAPDTSLLTVMRVGRVFQPEPEPASLAEIDQAAVPAPDDIAAWLASHPRLQTTSEPVVVGGTEGVRLQVVVLPGAGYPGPRCPTECVLLFPLNGPQRLFELIEGNQNRLDIFVVQGETVVVATEAPPAAFAGFSAEVDRVVDTLTIG